MSATKQISSHQGTCLNVHYYQILRCQQQRIQKYVKIVIHMLDVQVQWI